MVKYLLAKTIGKVEMDADGYPTGSLRPEKVPNCEAEFKAYSFDQSQVIIKCYDNNLDIKEFGESAKELTEQEAKALFEEWQNDWDNNCKCDDTSPEEHSRLNKPCEANIFAGVCHKIIDESKPKDTKEFDEWKKNFDKKPKIDFSADAEKRIRQRKENEILEIAMKIKSNPLTVKEQLDSIKVTPQEIDIEIDKIIEEENESHKYALIKHPLKTVKVSF